MSFRPQKGTKGAAKIICAFCAFLWLTLPLAAQTNATFIDDLQQRSFRYFWEQADPQTGLVPDRARIDGSLLPESHANVASIAATGFGLTSLCIAADRNWIDRSQALERARNTLRFFDARAFQQRGWFYHWMDSRTGARRWNSEVSSIDTALLLAGVLTVRQCFRDDREIVSLAGRIYHRVDFRWMRNGHPLLLSHGWKPETGFLKARWDTYSEDTILYLLAIASPTHPISPSSWYALWRDRYRYEGHSYFTTIGVPLFMHQYSHAWIDYRNRRENKGDRIDYFQNSVAATLAHRAFCVNLAYDFPAYGPDVWGITASDSAKGYLAWGGPPRDPDIDGTLVPSAAGGSLMFTPDLAMTALRTMREKYGEKIYGKYGFVDAFNPRTGWIDTDVIGINAGIILLSAENMRTANVWRWFMQNPEIPLALDRIGLRRYGGRIAALTMSRSDAYSHRRIRSIEAIGIERAHISGLSLGPLTTIDRDFIFFHNPVMKKLKTTKPKTERPRRVQLTKEEVLKRMKTFSERKERFLATARTGKS